MTKTPKNSPHKLIDDYYKDLETCDSLFDDFIHRYAKLKAYGDDATIIKIRAPEELYKSIIDMVKYYKNGGV